MAGSHIGFEGVAFAFGFSLLMMAYAIGRYPDAISIRVPIVIFGDGGQFPNLFFYNSVGTRSDCPFAPTFEANKAAGATGDDGGYVGHMKGVSDPETAGTRACSAADRSLPIQVYGAAVLEDPVLAAEGGSAKPCGITACIVSTARRENEQKSDISGRSKCIARIITFHDFADRAHACYCKKLAPGAPVVALQRVGPKPIRGCSASPTAADFGHGRAGGAL